MSAPQPLGLSVPAWGALRPQHALLHGVGAFSPVSVFPLLFATIWISPLISVSVWACGAALILMKHRPQAFRVASALALPLLRRQIFSPALLCEGAGIPVRLAIRYRRWSTPPLMPLPCGWALAIFFLSKKGLFSFATLRLLILREESRLVPFPGSQKPGVFFPICPSILLLPGSEIFWVLGTAKHASEFARTHRAGFSLRHRPVRGGDCQRLRLRRAQLRAKCESAPLRRSVSERAT